MARRRCPKVTAPAGDEGPGPEAMYLDAFGRVVVQGNAVVGAVVAYMTGRL